MVSMKFVGLLYIYVYALVGFNCELFELPLNELLGHVCSLIRGCIGVNCDAWLSWQPW